MGTSGTGAPAKGRALALVTLAFAPEPAADTPMPRFVAARRARSAGPAML